MFYGYIIYIKYIIYRHHLVEFLVFNLVALDWLELARLVLFLDLLACLLWFGLVAWFAFVCFAVLCMLACFALVCFACFALLSCFGLLS